jgi:low affinity Fe/Cu permease
LINTSTTILTFLLVALLQNTQRRGERVVRKKLEAIADGLSDVIMDHFANDEPDRAAREDLARDIKDLRAAEPSSRSTPSPFRAVSG